MKYRLAILSNERDHDSGLWIKACEKHADLIEYDNINLTKHNWLTQISANDYDYFLAKPPGLSEPFKRLYDERIFILAHVLNKPIFPSPEEIYIYENKRFFAHWLEARELPHPQTWIYYDKDDALLFLNEYTFPLVAKMNIGASGNGITMIKNKNQAEKYIKDAFSRGIYARTGPKLSHGRILQRLWRKLTHPGELKERLNTYKAVAQSPQKGFVIFQQYIPHNFEWRVVRIGDSFFAHKKLKSGEKSSGSLLKKYENPPKELLDFVKKATDRLSFYSQAVDIFEMDDGVFLINEMQCIFGQSDSYQMLVNGKPGRYRFIDRHWKFEEGMFNTNSSYDLRIQFILERINNKK